jgi:hypothetical protein
VHAPYCLLTDGWMRLGHGAVRLRLPSLIAGVEEHGDLGLMQLACRAGS